MNVIEIKTSIKVYGDSDPLSAEDQQLMNEAINQLDKAYAPYSRFHVGAAVRLRSGQIIGGSNQENASYPLCMCAERVALYHAAALYPEDAPVSMAITVRSEKSKIDKPVSPCGACRQVIAEYEYRHQQPIRIMLSSDAKEVYEVNGINALLPIGFDGSFLE